jgi:hypothetical protein
MLPAANGFAGSGTIVVHDGAGPACEQGGEEWMVMRLSSDEAVASLRHWLRGEPQDLVVTEKHIKAPDGWSAEHLRNFIQIAFTGYIKFCGVAERQKYFSAMIEALKIPRPDEKIFVLMLLHSRAKLLLAMLDEALAGATTDPVFAGNLQKAKRLIQYQRQTPEPYPTEKAVRRIEKRLQGAGK